MHGRVGKWALTGSERCYLSVINCNDFVDWSARCSASRCALRVVVVSDVVVIATVRRVHKTINALRPHALRRCVAMPMARNACGHASDNTPERTPYLLHSPFPSARALLACVRICSFHHINKVLNCLKIYTNIETVARNIQHELIE